MQVSVESIGGLQKRMTVQVPSNEIEQEVTNRLKSLVTKVKMDGFRPGKVPYKVVQQRYDGQVRQEVLESVIQKTFYQALTQEKLRPAGGPEIQPGHTHAGENFEYSATFEVYPDVVLESFDGVDFEKLTAEVTDADIDKMLDKLRVQQVTWNEVEREAKEEDQVTINFIGKIDGEPFEGGQAENHPLVLGSKTMIEGFEEQLSGVKKGDNKSIEVSFPEDYWKSELAGKPAVFDIEVIKVAEPVLPELDDQFAEKMGVTEGGLATLRDDVAKNMKIELDKKLQSLNKNNAMDLLMSRNPVELPESLVKQEIDTMKQQFQQDNPHRAEADIDDKNITEQAKKRVTLGILIGEVITKNDLSADSESCKSRINTFLENIASSYDEPEKVVAAYRNNQEMMGKIKSLALEEEVVDLLMSSMNIKEKTVSFDEVMNP